MRARLCKSLEKPRDKGEGKEKKEGDKEANTDAAMHVTMGTQVFSQTAQVTVTGPELGSSDGLKVRALFDTGAQTSYVSKRVADKLGLETVQTDNLVIATFGAEKQRVKAVNLVKLTVRKEETNFETNMNVYAVPKICSELKSQDIESAKRKYPHLNGIEFADREAEGSVMEIDLLIGSDYMWEFMEDKTVRGEPGQPVAISTKVGWLLSGPVEAQSREKLTSINFQSTHVLRVESESVKDDLDKLWDFDSVGIRERASVQEEFEQNVNFKDGRYFVNLPWREHHELLPDNYENCVVRLNSTVKRLRKQPKVFRGYNSVIEDQEREGIIERVDNSTIPEVGKVHYLPHHGVVRQQALSTKLRVVFDASAKAAPGLPSLNDCLNVGPALSPKIFDILIRFRKYRVAVVADIEKAFLNIGVEEIDRDVLRFLWIDELERDNPELLIYRFCRVVFGVNARAFLLNATLQNHIKHYNTDTDFADKLSESFYVDDLVAGEANDEDAFEFYQNSTECLSKGGFHLRKWASNSTELLDRIQDDRVKCETNEARESGVVEDTDTYAKTTVGNLEELQETDEHKVLGLPWNCKTDKLLIKFDGVLDGVEELSSTKRTVLKVAARLYDPLGIVSPVTVLMKMLLQEICARNLDWDSPLPCDLENKWRRWLQSLRQAKYVMISRCLYAGVQEEVQSCCLHGFEDASKRAYCAVVYLVIRTSIGSYVRLITLKTRVAPNKNYTIPRLELLSGLNLLDLSLR